MKFSRKLLITERSALEIDEYRYEFVNRLECDAPRQIVMNNSETVGQQSTTHILSLLPIFRYHYFISRRHSITFG